MDVNHNMIILGAGNLGQALANYAAFERSGFVLKGIFDVNPRLEGVTIRGIEIRMMDELSNLSKRIILRLRCSLFQRQKQLKLQICLWKAVSKQFGTCTYRFRTSGGCDC